MYPPKNNEFICSHPFYLIHDLGINVTSNVLYRLALLHTRKALSINVSLFILKLQNIITKHRAGSDWLRDPHHTQQVVIGIVSPVLDP